MMQARTIDVHGLSVRVHEDGRPDAPPLLLLHSLGTSAALWDPVLPALAASYRLIRPDMRGHGGTAATPGPYTLSQLGHDALGVLQALGIGQAAVAGISIGGLIAQEIAHLAPQRVTALVLIDTALVLPPASTWTERAALVRASGMAALAEPVLARWLTPAAPPHTVDILRRLLLATPAEGYAGCAEAIAGADLRTQSAGLAVPTLVLVGEADEATPVASAEALARAIPGARSEVIAAASHIPTAEQPAAVAGAMLRFVLPGSEGADMRARGMRTRRRALGDAHVDRSLGNATALDRDFQHWITEYAWGAVWSRPHFDARTRSIVTLALLAALGREDELTLHLRATRNTGATAEDITELLLHVAVYAGVPAANTAMRLAKEVLAERATERERAG